MKDPEARRLVQEIKERFPHVYPIIANQPGRSASWSIVEVHDELDSLKHFTLTSMQEWQKLQEIMAILLKREEEDGN